MALDSVEQELFDFAWGAMPRWYKARERASEEIAMFAKVMGAVKKTLMYWFQQAYIQTATRATGSDPDWLELHAQDRGTHLADGESNAVSRLRISQIPEAVTWPEIRDAAQAIVDEAGVTGTVALVELPKDAAYLGELTQDTGTGGTFSSLPGSATDKVFVPTVPFKFRPYRATTVTAGIAGWWHSARITIFDCAHPINDGAYPITGLVAADDADGDPTLTGVVFTGNTGAVDEADPTCSWYIDRLEYHGAVIDGTARAFVNRGFRIWRGSNDVNRCANGGIVVILPYGCTESHRLSVREMLRQKMAAGFRVIVERRITAP